MSKTKSVFYCQSCGYESAKWLGKCPSCEQWNSFAEEVLVKGNEKSNTRESWAEHSGKRTIKTVSLDEIVSEKEQRIVTADEELNRTLGGGIVPGSIILVAGEPGIGKSTLFLQNGLALKNTTVLYISGEESEQQIKMRAERLKIKNENFYLLTETATPVIFQEIKKLKPQLVIVDSIQTLESPYVESGA